MSDSNYDQDATLVIPTGGRAADVGKLTPSPQQLNADQVVDLSTLSGINPLVAAANPIFCSIPPLREMLNHPDPVWLRDSQLQQINSFEENARKHNISPESILIARYALCTFIDEAVASTPWGGTAELLRGSMLVTLHKEASGGEKFFQLLNKMAEDPGRHIDLLEFFYVCLALGFEGRFRVIEGGKTQLEGLRVKLAELIRRQRGEHEHDLSKFWRGEVIKDGGDGSLLKLWIYAAVVLLILLALYVFFLFRLNAHSDEIPLASITLPKPVQKESVQPKIYTPRLAKFLEEEIAQGLVTVSDNAAESIVSINGDGLFNSGGTDLKPEYQQIVERISNALNQVKGQIVVIGHTDNVPLRSIQYPSNWHLSKGRAQSVVRSIAPKLIGDRSIIAEGRGESEPIAPNDTPANKALNRRVEIVVKISS